MSTSHSDPKWANGDKFFKMKDGRVAGWVTPEAQLLAYEGFAPQALKVQRGRVTESNDDTPVPLLARPPAWTYADLPCVPPKGLERTAARDWMDQWDVRGGLPEARRAKARALCHGCPVLLKCLEAALTEESEIGSQHRYLVRGGLIDSDRSAIIRSRALFEHDDETACPETSTKRGPSG